MRAWKPHSALYLYEALTGVAVLVHAVLLASFSRMMGTLGLWTLLPAAAQGKSRQRGGGSLHHSAREKVHSKQQPSIWKRLVRLTRQDSADPVSCASAVLTRDLDIMFCLSLAAICFCLHSLLDSPFFTLDFSVAKQEDLCVL